MKLRLDTFPAEQIAARVPIPNASSPSTSPPTLCCLLHTGVLPPSHQIRVWVGGVQQRAEQEGVQQVFSWQCAQEVEMRIEILQQGRLTKTWRGWWRGGTTVAHTGNLAVQVFCGGVPQPAGIALPASAPAATSSADTPVDQHNGLHSQDGPSILTWPAFLPPPATPARPLDSEPEDDLWQTPPSASTRATEARIGERAAEEDLDPERQEAEVPGEEEGMERTTSEEETEIGGAATDGAQREAFAASHAHSRAESAHATPALPSVSAPAGTTIATFAALPVTSEAAHQEALERLRALLALLPPSTILVDLRRHRPTRRRPAGSAPLGLSKDLLRTLYGGRYWDRGLFIQIARRERVVLNPEGPDGLGALVAALARGWSLVILDGDRSYAESGRATVLAALRERVANLHEGPCS
jgi:hypothetical protein